MLINPDATGHSCSILPVDCATTGPSLLPRGGRASDGHSEAPTILHELHHVLHRLLMSATTRCALLVHRLQFGSTLFQTGENISVLGVFRQDRASHELPQRVPCFELTHYVLVIFHWNACLYHIISKNGGFGSDDWFFPSDNHCKDNMCKYLHAFIGVY
ncbi:hypothetical protein CEXT_344711 [Caerostris extrusa]|uniref:Uncharacterized protein n=1 Tax=Caerostris extrusa TaxID=172846 RepID=A0AAV4P368_CAEEX|nr:hypothetical protein CEXT_344711 [Caerostris extrusa]